MATNLVARNFNTKRTTVGATAEAGVVLEQAQTIRYINVHCLTAINVRISFTPGGCFSADDYFTLKSGTTWEVNDIALKALTAGGIFFYAMSEAGTVTLEALYGYD